MTLLVQVSRISHQGLVRTTYRAGEVAFAQKYFHLGADDGTEVLGAGGGTAKEIPKIGATLGIIQGTNKTEERGIGF